MSYRSSVDIKIGRIPEVPDEDFYPIFQEVYNALHILNANIDAAVEVLTPPNPGTSANESFSPRLNTFWAPAAANVGTGRVCSMNTSANSFQRGVKGYSAGSERITDPFGVCVEDNKDGFSRIAWPPFVLEVDMSESGAPIGAKLHTDKTGGIFYLEGQDLADYWPVAQLIDTDMLLFIPNMRN